MVIQDNKFLMVRKKGKEIRTRHTVAALLSDMRREKTTFKLAWGLVEL